MPQKKHTIPNTASKLLTWFCNPAYLEDILGDLEEEYEIVIEEREIKLPKLWLYGQIILLFRITLIKETKPIIYIQNSMTMFRNYIKIGIRNLWKYKSSTVINLVGLSTGIASFLLIFLFVMDEISFDQHHENAKDIYRVTVKNFDRNGALNRQWACASAGHAPRIKEDFAQVTHAVRFFPWAFPDILVDDKRFPGEQIVFCDPDVFDIFTFPFIIGNSAVALTNPESLVLTESSAIKLFGNDWQEMDLLSKTVLFDDGDKRYSINITGVMEDMPVQQHFHFDYLSPWSLLEKSAGEKVVNNVGGNYNYLSYVKVNPNTKVEDLNAQSDTFFNKYIEPNNSAKASERYKLDFQPLLDIHLKSSLAGEIETNSDVFRVYISGVVGVLLLIIACINYMNLATSRYSRRMKEIGVRKAIGATRASLISQFMTESLLLTVLSLPIAILLTYLALPYLNDLVFKSMVFNLWENQQMIFSLIALVLGIGIVAGLYPSLYLSSMKILDTLKGESSIRYQKINFRSILVTFQYVVAVWLIFALLVVNEQLDFVFNTSPGYDKEQILSIRLSKPVTSKLEGFKSQLLSHSNVVSATAASRIPTNRLNDNAGARFVENDSSVNLDFRLPYIGVDEDFLTTFGIELAAGQDFEAHMKSDSIGYFIINSKAAKNMGFANVADAVGLKLDYGGQVGRVLGVTKDFHFESIHNKIRPMIMRKTGVNYRRLNVKISPQNMEKTLAFIEAEWAKIDPVYPIQYMFVDDLFEQQYTFEQRLSIIFKIFTVIAIMISCLGMLGMVSFIIERKLKEIGIRKVLGASILNVIWLIGKYFTYLIVIGSLIAIPLGVWLMNIWLENFAYQISIDSFLIFSPIVLIAILSAATILYSTVKASLVNPVECLKDE